MEPWMIWLVYLAPGIPVAIWIATCPEPNARAAASRAEVTYSRNLMLSTGVLAGLLWPIALVAQIVASKQADEED